MTYPGDGAPYVPVRSSVAMRLDGAASQKQCLGPGCEWKDGSDHGRPRKDSGEEHDHVAVAGSPARFVRDIVLAVVPFVLAF